ncbi:hypothetical protein [Muribaculum gordoncarteri]|uniref:hypothetical protein n=1 Tax=Muribaculum gordoncarteri TaxID=2530390 RepID=UPI003F66FA35
MTNTDLSSNPNRVLEAATLALPVTRTLFLTIHRHRETISFPDDVAGCDHEQSCGYHLTPKEYFERIRRTSLSTPIGQLRQPAEPRRRDTQASLFIEAETVAQTLHGYNRNNLFLFLNRSSGPMMRRD